MRHSRAFRPSGTRPRNSADTTAAIEVLELVGISERSRHDAVESALDEARKSVRNIQGVDVVCTTAKVRDGKIAEYHSDVKIAYVVEGESRDGEPVVGRARDSGARQLRPVAP